MTRLTVLLDPGRIKRGLLPHRDRRSRPARWIEQYTLSHRSRIGRTQPVGRLLEQSMASRRSAPASARLRKTGPRHVAVSPIQPPEPANPLRISLSQNRSTRRWPLGLLTVESRGKKNEALPGRDHPRPAALRNQSGPSIPPFALGRRTSHHELQNRPSPRRPRGKFPRATLRRRPSTANPIPPTLPPSSSLLPLRAD